MSQTISRMYQSHARATEAAEALRNGREVSFAEVYVCSSQTTGGTPSTDAIVAALVDSYVLKSHAAIYADGIRRGGALVTVHAPFGTAVTAIETLERFDPIDSGVTESSDVLPAWNDATPVSSLLNLPVLLDDSATFARFWNLPALSRTGATISSRFGLPEVSDGRGPFNGTFPLPLLSRSAAPLSSMLGLPLLTKSRDRG